MGLCGRIVVCRPPGFGLRRSVLCDRLADVDEENLLAVIVDKGRLDLLLFLCSLMGSLPSDGIVGVFMGSGLSAKLYLLLKGHEKIGPVLLIPLQNKLFPLLLLLSLFQSKTVTLLPFSLLGILPLLILLNGKIEAPALILVNND